MNKIILKNFLNRTFFKSWQEARDDNYSNLEIQISASCPLKCVYCYYNKNAKILNPPEICKKENLKKNFNILLNWLEENKYFPNIDLFTGEVFSNEVGFYIVEKLINYFKKYGKKRKIIIPSNFSFITDKEKVQKIKNLIKLGKTNNIDIILSCSIDGKYLDNINRPYKNNFQRGEEFYDRVFKFCSKYNIGFHPMIYSKGIEKWIDNFNWFQKMFEKYNIPWNNLYLLEVRNSEWNKKQIKEFYRFIKYVSNFILEKQKNLSIKEILKKRNLNIFNVFSKVGRGIGCSIQSTIQIRLGDLSVFPCHRLAYPELRAFYFKVKNNKIVDIIPDNLDLYLTIMNIDNKTFPFCQNCLIKNFCPKGCLGENYETMGDIFITSPNICLLEFTKLKAILDSFKEKNRLNELLNILNEENRINLINFINI